MNSAPFLAFSLSLASIGFLQAAEAAPVSVTAAPSSLEPVEERTLIQTQQLWSPKGNLRSDVAMVYGFSDDLSKRVESWKREGYRVHFMTGVSWGHYQDYIEGRFDGVKHEDEKQTDAWGRPLPHGRSTTVFYMCPGINYGKFLCVGVQKALDAGAEAIHLEEPEFFDRAGYSEGFKREWAGYYHEPWQSPHSTVDAHWRGAKLKYFLYRRALQQVFDYVQAYNQRTGRHVRCYVATHSLINYARWHIISPESSLAQLNGCDGYIAQVWTGTSRVPNTYRGDTRTRTFETAFLEYGAMQNLVRATGRSVWYLNDPIEDDPDHDWTDYRTNWESTLTASLFQPDVAQYEVAPWPERIFDLSYPRDSWFVRPRPIPPAYATELQTVTSALNDMKQPRVEWDCGTPGVGVLVSDSLMFQRGDPSPSDLELDNVYGLALPLLKHGLPVTPVQLENVTVSHYLDSFRVLLLSYDGQKPLSAAVHAPIVDWVKQGGVLIVCDRDADPYLKVREWWNSDGRKYATPREHLFGQLGLAKDIATEKFNPVGKGGVIWLKERPADLANSAAGANLVLTATQLAAKKIGLPWKESNALLLRRGPYLIAAGLDETIAGPARTLSGRFVNLFDAGLRVQNGITVAPGTRFFLLDLDTARTGTPHVLASACQALPNESKPGQLSYTVNAVGGTPGIVLLESPQPPRAITLAGKPVTDFTYSPQEKLLWVRFPNEPKPRELAIVY